MPRSIPYPLARSAIHIHALVPTRRDEVDLVAISRACNHGDGCDFMPRSIPYPLARSAIHIHALVPIKTDEEQR
jgi:uncharacterized membrane protein YukC